MFRISDVIFLHKQLSFHLSLAYQTISDLRMSATGLCVSILLAYGGTIALETCFVNFHLMSFPRIWVKDPFEISSLLSDSLYSRLCARSKMLQLLTGEQRHKRKYCSNLHNHIFPWKYIDGEKRSLIRTFISKGRKDSSFKTIL